MASRGWWFWSAGTCLHVQGALAALVLATADAATVVVKYVSEFEFHKKKPPGIGYYVFVVYFVMVHIALAFAVQTHYERGKQAVDLSFITVTVNELKVKCKKRGLQVGGKKCELISRLAAVPDFSKRRELLQWDELHNEFKDAGMMAHVNNTTC